MKIDFHHMRAIDLRTREAPVERYPHAVRLLIWSLCAIGLVAFWAVAAMGVLALFG